MKLLEKLKPLSEGRLIRGVQAALLAWLLMTTATAAVRHLITSGQAAEAIAAYQSLEKQSAENAPKNDDRIAKLLANNLFVPPAAARPPQCLAILGDAALFGDKWYKVGDTAAGAKILEIGANFVKVIWNDKEQTLHPFDVEVNYAAPAGGSARPAGPSGQPAPPRTASPPPSAPSEERGRSGGPSGRGEEMRRRFESLTPEQRQQLFERYQNASPEERERMREEFRQGRSNER